MALLAAAGLDAVATITWPVASEPRSCSELVNLKFDNRARHDCGEVVKGN